MMTYGSDDETGLSQRHRAQTSTWKFSHVDMELRRWHRVQTISSSELDVDMWELSHQCLSPMPLPEAYVVAWDLPRCLSAMSLSECYVNVWALCHRLRLRLHGDVFTRKRKPLFADAPFVYTKTVKTLALLFLFWRCCWKWKLLKTITRKRQLSTCKCQKRESVL